MTRQSKTLEEHLKEFEKEAKGRTDPPPKGAENEAKGSAQEAKQRREISAGMLVRDKKTDKVGRVVRPGQEVHLLLSSGETYRAPAEDLEVLWHEPHGKSDAHKPGEPTRVNALLGAALERLETRALDQEKPIPLPWPHVAPQFGGGLWPGLHVAVGGTGAGKSQLALEIALHAAMAEVPVLYVALELGDLDLVARLLALKETGRQWSDLYLGKAKGADWFSAKAKALELQDLPLYFEVGIPGGWPYDALSKAARVVREKHPDTDPEGKRVRGSRPFLVILDFLQIVSDGSALEDPKRSLELRERVGRAAYAGRQIARDLDAAVLLVSSTARDKYGLAGKEVITAHLTEGGRIGRPDTLLGIGKESGEIEYAADTVTVLARWPDSLPEGGGPRGWGEGPLQMSSSVLLATVKVRAGVPRWSELRFDGTRFYRPPDGGAALLHAMQEAEEQVERPRRKSSTAKAERAEAERRTKEEERARQALEVAQRKARAAQEVASSAAAPKDERAKLSLERKKRKAEEAKEEVRRAEAALDERLVSYAKGPIIDESAF